jgi:hypothetical protein
MNDEVERQGNGWAYQTHRIIREPRKQGGPHIIYHDGTLQWFSPEPNALVWRHRDGDKPAVIDPNGSLMWYHRGELHRECDKPALIDCNRSGGGLCISWYRWGNLHRDGGPAVIRIYPGSPSQGPTYEWWRNGEYHRDDGPAVIHSDGTLSWYQDGKRIR